MGTAEAGAERVVTAVAAAGSVAAEEFAWTPIGRSTTRGAGSPRARQVRAEGGSATEEVSPSAAEASAAARAFEAEAKAKGVGEAVGVVETAETAGGR